MAGAPVQVSRVRPQVRPAPKTQIRTLAPAGSARVAAAEASANGAEAAPMLPVRSPVTINRSAGTPISAPSRRSSTGLG